MTETGGSPRALIAQWRAKALEDLGYSAGPSAYCERELAYEDCADALEKALAVQTQALADLEAEMRAFAERHHLTKKADGSKFYSAAGKAALAWAETVKGLQG